jgi:hypothetical protein
LSWAAITVENDDTLSKLKSVTAPLHATDGAHQQGKHLLHFSSLCHTRDRVLERKRRRDVESDHDRDCFIGLCCSSTIVLISCFRYFCLSCYNLFEMALFIGMVSQKGGVRKSTLARLVAREYAKAGWNVKIADLDISQGTSYNWQARRLQNSLEPVIAVERFGTVDQAPRLGSHYDLVILDGPPHSTAGTLKIAQAAEMVVLPSGLSLDDLEPSVLLAHELVKKGIPRNRIVFALCRVGESEIGDCRGALLH